ncbi:hypothetical protein ACHAO8_004479 [Botrytis cinerea]
MVPQAKVFYLAKYRDSSTTRNGRVAGCNKLAAKEATQRAPPAVLSKKQARYGKARETLLSAYSRKLETWHLQRALQLMEQADEDPKYMPAPSNAALIAFLNNEEEDSGEADAEAMNKEIAELWPGF